MENRVLNQNEEMEITKGIQCHHRENGEETRLKIPTELKGFQIS